MQAHPSSRVRRRRDPSTKTTRPTHRPRRDRIHRGRGAPAARETGEARRAAAELRALPARWLSALRTVDVEVHERAAQLYDELHAVANRVGRLLETPGVRLPPIRLQAPTSRRQAVPREVRGAQIRVAADRLAGLVDGLSARDWRTSGTVGDSPITIGQLVASPLHSSHRLLAFTRAPRPMIEPAAFGVPDARAEHARHLSLVS
jgi:hypothetical protein